MSDESIALPRELELQFEALERRLWRIDAAVAGCGAAGALIASYALLFISDRLWDTPVWLRAGFTVLGLGVLVWFAYGYGRRWVWGKRGFEALAGLVQKRYRRLGDRLLGIVELADVKRRPGNVSAALCAAAIGQVAAEAAKIDFRQAASPRKSYKYAEVLAGLVLLGAIPWVFAPEAGWNALKRWVWPGSNVARYTFVSLSDLPARKVVAHGEPFEIACSVAGSSVWHPARATCRFEGQPEMEAPVVGGNMVFHVPGQTENGFLTLRVGDVSKRMFIEPVYRPELKELRARVELPAYLGYAPFVEKVEGGAFSVLRGSKVGFDGVTSRDLEQAWVMLGPTPGKVGSEAKVEARDHGFHAEAVALDRYAQVSMTWRDIFGLEAGAPENLKIETKEDLAAEVESPGTPEAVAILAEEVVHVPVSAQDDYGVREAGLAWDVTTGQGAKAVTKSEARTVLHGGQHAKALKGSFEFSPQLLGIAEDSTVALRVTASDYYPGRAVSESAVYRIYVLGKEAHARLIEEQLAKISGELEDVTRKQEALLDAGKQTGAQKPEELANAESAQKLGEQGTEQAATAEQLSGIAKEIASTLKEGLRNTALSEKVLKDWGKLAESMQGLSQNEMPGAAQSLNAAGQEGAGRPQDLAKALAQEQKALEQLHAMQKGADKALDGLTAANIALRLRGIAAAEGDVSKTFQGMLPETVGLKTDQLPAEKRDVVEKMQGSEEASRKESNELQDEIARFFDRTRLAKYGDVSKEMGDGKIDEGLEALAGLVGRNTSVGSIQGADGWQTQFNGWADELEKANDSRSADATRPPSEKEMEALMALVRLRQQEASLRDQTVALDAGDFANPKTGGSGPGPETPGVANGGPPTEGAKTSPRELGMTQNNLEDAVKKMQAEPGYPVPPKQLEPVRRAMDDAGGMLSRSITGDATVGAETDAVNLLDYLLDGSEGGSKGASMAMLRQMMGLGRAGHGGTGSMAGGVPSGPNAHVGGSRAGTGDAPRTVTTTGGRDLQTVPAEFRDALQSYWGSESLLPDRRFTPGSHIVAPGGGE